MREYNNMTEEELIAESIKLKGKILELKDKRLLIKSEISKRQLEKQVKDKLGKMSDDELEIMKGIIITPEPAVLRAKGN